MRIAITQTASDRIQEAVVSDTPIIFSRVQLTGTGTYSTRDVHKPADGSDAGVSVLIDKNDVTGSPVFNTFNLYAKLGTGSEFLFATAGVDINFGGSEDRKIILTVLLEINESDQVIFEYSGGDDAYQVAVQQGFEGTAQEWLEGLVGPKGDTGPRGLKGDKGDKGDQGIQGPRGLQGPKGDKGDTGDTGARGPQGLKGDTGDTGPKGDKGDTGPRGPQGEIGPEGPKGDKGDKGDQGIQGPEGPRGLPGEIEELHSAHVVDALGYLPVDPIDLTWGNLSGKPSTFAPSAHSHSWAQITSKPSTFAPSAHSHSWSQVTDKPTTFPTSWTEVTGKPASFTPSSHNHSWTQITGKPTTFTPSPHPHTIANVTGIQTAMDGKAGTAVATTGSSGLMSASDKTKLNGLSSNATTLQGRNASAFMQVVNHGTQANTSRPVGAIAVYWIGTVEPNNAQNGDIWVGGA